MGSEAKDTGNVELEADNSKKNAHKSDGIPSSPSDLINNSKLPNWIRNSAGLAVILIGVYPAYLGIAKLNAEKRESDRQQLQAEKDRADAAFEQKEKEVEIAKANSETESAKLKQLEIENQEKYNELRLTLGDQAKARSDKDAQDLKTAEKVEDESFSNDVRSLLSEEKEPGTVAARTALLARHVSKDAPPYRRSAIIAALATRLQSVKSPEDVDAIFSILTLAGPEAFPVVVRANQKAFAALAPALAADHRAHHLGAYELSKAGVITRDTDDDIIDVFNESAVSTSLQQAGQFAYQQYTPAGALTTSVALDPLVIVAAHRNLTIVLAILIASRDAVAYLLPKIENDTVTLDRCFLPETFLSANPGLKSLTLKYSYISFSDLRGLGTSTNVLIQAPIDPANPIDLNREAISTSLDFLKITWYQNQRISLRPAQFEK